MADRIVLRWAGASRSRPAHASSPAEAARFETNESRQAWPESVGTAAVGTASAGNGNGHTRRGGYPVSDPVADAHPDVLAVVARGRRSAATFDRTVEHEIVNGITAVAAG